jgi:uncharacterized membrane protein YozB (DUF420 family)
MIEAAVVLIVLGVTTLSVAMASRGITHRQFAYITVVAMVVSFTGVVLAFVS